MSLVKLVFSISFFALTIDVVASEYSEVDRRGYRDVKAHVNLSDVELKLVEISQLVGLDQSEAASHEIQKAYREKVLNRQQIIALLTQLTSYVGFPKINEIFATLPDAIQTHKITLPKDKINERFNIGKQYYEKLDPKGFEIISGAFGDIAPQLVATTYPLFGDAFTQGGVTIREKQLITVSCLTAIGTAMPQLNFHVGTSLKVGLTSETLMDIAVISQYYAGMPAAYNLALAVKQHVANASANPYSESAE